MSKVLSEEDGDTIWNDPFDETEGSDLVAIDFAYKQDPSYPPKQAGTTPSTDGDRKLPKLQDDLMYQIQDIVTNHITMSGDPLFDLAEDLAALITQERNKAIQKELIRHIANLSYAAGWMNDHPYIAKELELAQARLEEEKE